MALLAPFLLLIVVGAIDIGRFAKFKIVVGNSARVGAQYGSLNVVSAEDFSGMQAAAASDATGITLTTVSATNYCKCADGSAASCTPTACSSNHRILFVSVTSSATFKPILKYPFIGSSIAVSRTAVEQVAQ